VSKASELIAQIKQIEAAGIAAISSATSSDEIEMLRVRYLGKKGEVSEVLASLRNLSNDEKKEVGNFANEVKQKFESLIEAQASRLQRDEMNRDLANDRLDATLPGVSIAQGARHPLSLILNEAQSILERAGLQAVFGPEVEYEDFCFDKLNFKEGHAARDMQATFFVKDEQNRKLILRTHTSPVQVRVLLKMAQAGSPLPIRVQVPGRVYRVDDDATHAPMFHQIEGLVVDTSSTMGDLRATLDFFFREFFGSSAKIRFRPSYFPFTEPSAEVDVSCVFCRAKGCRVCKESGWLEVAGAGLVHPEVFQLCGWNPEKVQGWAFGMGIERLTMLKMGIPDLRNFFENRLTFLRGGLS